MERLAKGFAVAGGLVLSALILLTCISIVGRSLNGLLHSDALEGTGLSDALLAAGAGGINGDFELVEAGMAFVIFAFLPLCQLAGAHASVDIFTSKLPPRAQRILRAVIEILFAAAIVLIAVQLFAGMESKRATGQTTFQLQFPLWWAYAASMTAAAAAALVAIYVAAMRVLEAATNRTRLPETEAGH